MLVVIPDRDRLADYINMLVDLVCIIGERPSKLLHVKYHCRSCWRPNKSDIILLRIHAILISPGMGGHLKVQLSSTSGYCRNLVIAVVRFTFPYLWQQRT